MNPAGLSVLLLTDEKESLSCVKSAPDSRACPMLVRIGHLVNILSKTCCWSSKWEKWRLSHQMYSPVTSLLMSRNWTSLQKCKVRFQNMLSVQDALNALGASVIQQDPVVCKWVTLLVFRFIYLLCKWYLKLMVTRKLLNGTQEQIWEMASVYQ